MDTFVLEHTVSANCLDVYLVYLPPRSE